MHGPLPAYRAKVAAGELAPDASQQLAAERLQALWARLRGYDPPPRPANGGGLLGRLLRRKPTDEGGEDRADGLYLVGEVGRGKSMLMDLFFAAADVARKRRIHFHRFMHEAHARIHAWRQADPHGADPIPPLADSIAAEAALLCFDELQVNDIADALILEFVEAEQRGLGGNAVGQRRNRICAIRIGLPPSVDPRVRLLHEAVEVDAPFARHVGGGEEQVHQHRLAAADLADEVNSVGAGRQRRVDRPAAQQARQQAIAVGVARRQVVAAQPHP